VLPLTHRCHRRTRQFDWAVNQLKIRDVTPPLADLGSQPDRAVNVCGSGVLRVNGIDLLNQEAWVSPLDTFTLSGRAIAGFEGTPSTSTFSCPAEFRGFCRTWLRQNCDRVESSHNRVQSFLVRRTGIPDQQMVVGGRADNALMTASNTPRQIDTEVAGRCRELFDTA